MSDIRVTYSGLISFLVGISSILTGTVFTLIVTRQLTVEEFGTWGLIGSIIAYVLLLESSIFFWITRETARKVPTAKTGVISSGMFSLVGVIIFIILASLMAEQVKIDTSLMIFAVLLVPVNFINHTLTGLNTGWKPQIASYGFISTELCKVPLALVFVYFLNMGLEGVIITMVFSYLTSIILQAYFARKKLQEKFQTKFIKKWIKLSWIALYRDIPGILYVSDIVIFSTISGNVIGIAYIGAARTISNLVRHSGRISTAIYPKMLEGGKQEHLQENLVRTLYFAFPIVAFSIVFARPGLFALNPEYEIAFTIVIFLSFRTLLATLNRIFRSALQGIEKIDVSENAGFRDYVKSFLIIIPTVRTIQYASYVVLLSSGLYLLVENESSQLDLVTYWAIIAMCIEIPFMIYFTILIRKKFNLDIDFKNVFKYAIVSAVSFGITHLLMEKFLVYDISIFNFLPNLIIFLIFGLGFYFGITYLVDKKTRNLVNMVMKEIQKK